MSNQEKKKNNYKSAKVGRRDLTIMCILVAVGALGGGVLAIAAPDGSLIQASELIPVLQKIPVLGAFMDSLLVPGIILLIFVFVPQTVAAVLLIKKHPRQYRAGMVAGVFLSLITICELIFMGSNVLSWVFLVLGFVELGVAFISSKEEKLT